MSAAAAGLAFVAGALSILSPCVLPLAPIVFTTAAGSHRYGPIALAAVSIPLGRAMAAYEVSKAAHYQTLSHEALLAATTKFRETSAAALSLELFLFLGVAFLVVEGGAMVVRKVLGYLGNVRQD